MDPVTKNDLEKSIEKAVGSLKESIGQMFVAQTKQFQEKFDEQNETLDAIKLRIDGVSEIVEGHEKRIVVLEQTVGVTR